MRSLRFLQRRNPGGIAGDLALRCGVFLADFVNGTLRVAPARARVALGSARRGEVRFRRLDRATLGFGLAARVR